MWNTQKHSWACRATIAMLVTGMLMTATVFAMPPHPSLYDGSSAAAKTGREIMIPSSHDWHSRGICTPSNFFGNALSQMKKNGDIQASPTAGTYRILAILVQFSDHPSTVPTTFFDSLVFDTAGKTVKDYFKQISNGTIDLVTVNLPSSLGWRTAPQTYAYYVNGQQGTGTYPQNSQKLVEDLVDQIDPFVDFSNYDNDGNGTVDVLLVIHSGTGAEFSGSPNDIWSHKWAITPRLKDGVTISDYTVQPEYWTSPGDMTIGVYSHELCHGFGLPDLYDTDGSSNGIGRWGIMATGSWNGPTGFGESPAFPCAWSRIHMGITTPVNLTTNRLSQVLNAIENGGSVYRLWTSGGASNEHFLVEN
ncbi:MAG: M6 family metalloprotease domain-containing protein, partial [Candidatus Zixiibacteriota bacterium]